MLSGATPSLRVRALRRGVPGVGPGGLVYSYSIYPYSAHTAEEPVGDGPRGRCYDLVKKYLLSEAWAGKGLKQG